MGVFGTGVPARGPGADQRRLRRGLGAKPQKLKTTRKRVLIIMLVNFFLFMRVGRVFSVIWMQRVHIKHGSRFGILSA